MAGVDEPPGAARRPRLLKGATLILWIVAGGLALCGLLLLYSWPR